MTARVLVVDDVDANVKLLEARLAAALAYRDTQTCPSPSGFSPSQLRKSAIRMPLSAVDGVVHKSPWHQNRILWR